MYGLYILSAHLYVLDSARFTFGYRHVYQHIGVYYCDRLQNIDDNWFFFFFVFIRPSFRIICIRMPVRCVWHTHDLVCRCAVRYFSLWPQLPALYHTFCFRDRIHVNGNCDIMVSFFCWFDFYVCQLGLRV